MIAEPGADPADEWSDWLLRGRSAGDADFARAVQGVVDGYAERVLDGARPGPGMTLLDVGTGEGVVAFKAIERVGPSLAVVMADISAPLLAHAEQAAVGRGIRRQCTFLRCGAERLDGVADASVDVVTTRAVLAYVADKPAALREFLRVLRPGGRLSIAEPLFRDEALAANALRLTLEAQPPGSRDRFMTLLHRWKSAQFPDTDAKIAASPIANYTERDLLRFVHGCGFCDIHLELHIDVGPSDMPSWEVFIGSSPHPWAPPLGVILATQFSAEEREFFERTIRPTLTSKEAVSSSRVIYLTARKRAP